MPHKIFISQNTKLKKKRSLCCKGNDIFDLVKVALLDTQTLLFKYRGVLTDINFVRFIYTPTVSMIKTRLMPARELMGVYCENHTNPGFLNFKPSDIRSYIWALNG